MERKSSQQKIDYNDKYNKENYTSVIFRVKKGQNEKIKEYAAKKGMSLNKYITSLIAADMGEEYGAGEEP